MAPKSSQSSISSQKTGKKPPKSSLKVNTLKLETKGTRRINPLTAFANIPASQSSQSQPKPYKDLKGKGKAKAEVIDLTDDANDNVTGQLWVDMYEPSTEAELAVHKRKVQDVRGWLQESFSGKNKYRRILALTGPSGTAKTTTIRILARELDFEILEWTGPTGNVESSFARENTLDLDEETVFAKFESFLTRASSCQPLFTDPSQSGQASKQKIVLLEDLPNILHSDTKTRFHAVLQSLVSSDAGYAAPLVFIVSDNGLRGEASDERQASGSWGKDQAIDIRTVIPSELLHGPYATQIRFNPIAPTIMKKALQAMLTRHFGSSKSIQPSKEVLEIVVESANGDIRSAINALQFSCIAASNGKKRTKGREATIIMESVTRREQSLALFHLVGKVLYNKRKGDPSASSASAKDTQREKELDGRLMDPPFLPQFLSDHHRRTSRVDVDILYSDSPIDSSLFSLYIHQNYTQFCNDIDNLDGVADNLSWIDSSGGEQWYQANPHRFHMLTMGTLHALPSPVERRSQKIYKPDFFNNLEKEKDAWNAVHDVRRWLLESAISKTDAGWRAGGWSRNCIAMELGGVLKARDDKGSTLQTKAPSNHRAFSNLNFVLGSCGIAAQLGETDGDEHDASIMLDGAVEEENPDVAAAKRGGWLDTDDIEPS